MRNEKGTEDFFGECFSTLQGKMKSDQFDQSFCKVCKNFECVRAGWVESSWIDRMDTQVERLLTNPNFADIRDPRFSKVREHDFPNLLQEAIRIEIVDQKNDWSIPTESDVQAVLSKGKVVLQEDVAKVQDTDKSSEIESSTTIDEKQSQEKPNTNLTGTLSETPQFEQGFLGRTEKENPNTEIKSLIQDPQNPFINTPFPKEGLMADGTTFEDTPSPKPKMPANFVGDEWTAPEMKSKPKNLVKKGARIQMGSSKKDTK